MVEWRQRFRVCLGLATDPKDLETRGTIRTRSMFRALPAIRGARRESLHGAAGAHGSRWSRGGVLFCPILLLSGSFSGALTSLQLRSVELAASLTLSSQRVATHLPAATTERWMLAVAVWTSERAGDSANTARPLPCSSSKQGTNFPSWPLGKVSISRKR